MYGQFRPSTETFIGKPLSNFRFYDWFGLPNAEKTVQECDATMSQGSNLAWLKRPCGIESQVSTLFLLDVGDIIRFKGFDPLNNLVGFYPGSNSSGDKDNDTGNQLLE